MTYKPTTPTASGRVWHRKFDRVRRIKLYAQRLLRVSDWMERRLINNVPRMTLTILLASTICSLAQRGTMTPKATTSFGLPMLVAAPVVFKQTLLAWNNESGASNRVAWGLARNAWTNGSRIVLTNVFPVTNGWSYAVTQIVNGVESIPALWPSNRVFQYWLVDKGSNFNSVGTNITMLQTGTNIMPESQHFWGIKDLTVGWQ